MESKKIVVLIGIVLTMLLIVGCAKTEPSLESANLEPTAKEITTCPSTCDDNNTLTDDYCSSDTGFNCVNKEISMKTKIELLQDDLNKALDLDYIYKVDEEATDSKKITHHKAVVNVESEKLIVIDELDFSIKNNDMLLQTLKSQKKTYFLASIKKSREEYNSYLANREYYFDDSPYKYYANQTTETTTMFDNLTKVEGFDFYETVYGAIDVHSIEIKRKTDSDPSRKYKFYTTAQVLNRMSILCTPNLIVNIYAKQPEYQEMDLSAPIVKSKDSSHVIRTIEEAKDGLTKDAVKIEKVCNAYN